jgi:hypothetical protein
MKPCLLAVLSLVTSWVVLLSPPAAFADPDKEAELLKRIEQLEKRVAELEKAALVGEWVGDNDHRVGRVFTRFVVSNKDNEWSIKPWLNLGAGREAEMPMVTLSPFGPNSKSRPHGFATWETDEKKGIGGMNIQVFVRFEKDTLVVETVTTYRGVPGAEFDIERFTKK